MSRSSFLLALLFAAPLASGASGAPAFAQEKTPEKQQEKPPEKPAEKPVEKKETKDTLNQKAVDALVAKKYDEGIAFLMKILETAPKDNSTAYNLACAYALKNDPEKGFEWLGKAVDWGWGAGSGRLVGSTTATSNLEMTKTDPDLAILRKDPRWEKLIERIASAGASKAPAKADAYAAAAASYIPEKAKGAKELPVLVVLHDDGGTKDKIVSGRWKAVADELGFALLAPSGMIPAGDDPAKGMAWFKKPEEYAAQAPAIDKGVADAIAAFAKEHPIDRQRTVLVGEGTGGLVAMNVALTGPGLCKGVVTIDGKFNPDLYASKAPAAGKSGVRVELLIDGAKTAQSAGPEGGPEKVAASQTKLLQTWGLPGEARVFTPDPKDPEGKGLLVEAVRAVLAPAATTAAAPK